MLGAFISASLSAAPAMALEFPLLAHDLHPGERIVTAVHATGGGPQTGAKDLRILRHVADNNWQVLKAGKTDDSVNSNYLIYGRPVYAMASGQVIGCWRNAPENTGHTKHPENATGKIYLQGNHLWIKQTDGKIALYAHAPTGDIPSSLCPHNGTLLTGKAQGGPVWTEPEAAVTNGATVTAGQLLYHVGNSGNSSEPHLHVHVVDTSNTWQPMKFARGQTTPFNNTASLNGPWTRLQGSALPSATILVWPPHPVGNWTYNGIEAAAYQRVFDHFVDSGVMADTVSCKNNGATYDTTWIPAKGSWVSHHGMSIADHAAKNLEYTKQGYKETSVYTCGSVMAAIWRKSEL
ncbi:MAG: hypothetical protein JF606_20605 [Burkholderiales bacterium]|jgi:hypothetical protein|nr:hypothetical protein [Burkholderiales bacterium]